VAPLAGSPPAAARSLRWSPEPARRAGPLPLGLLACCCRSAHDTWARACQDRLQEWHERRRLGMMGQSSTADTEGGAPTSFSGEITDGKVT